jgi:NADPH-dependent 2,4-dienoyl-CoA reductase/sulfur reductase-like enzyme
VTTRLVIVGGSDAGIMAGLRARQVDPSVQPLLVVADAYPNFSICGIPYHVSGEVPDWRTLAHRSRADLDAAGLRLCLDTRAEHIDPGSRTVTVTGPDGRTEELGYDRLILGTGAVPVLPPIAGLDRLGPTDGVHVLHTMTDTFALTSQLARHPETALIVGAGYIGLEMAEALTTRGLQVTVVEQLPQVLATVDAPLAALVADELARHDVEVDTGTTVTAIAPNADPAGGRLAVTGHITGDTAARFSRSVDLVLVVVGVRPDTALAQTAGIALGARGAIAVDRQMRTSVPGIFAAGDCVHTYHRILDADSYLPLGTTAHKQGTVAGENSVGGERVFAGSLGTQVVKVFDLVAARTGLRDHEATAAGFTPASTTTIADDHKAYYPGARPITITVTGDTRTGRLLGAQLVGHRDTAVAKRVDTYATALHHGMTVADVADLDLSYTPPLGSPYDAIQAATQQWTHIDRAPSTAAALNPGRLALPLSGE